MKLAISNIAWPFEERLKAYTLMQQYGLTGLEIAPSLFLQGAPLPYQTLRETSLAMKVEAEAYGLNLVSMQSLHFGAGPMQLFESESSREALLTYSINAVEFAASLDIANLVFGSPKNRCIPDEMPHAQAMDIAFEFFRKLGQCAYENRTCIALEPNAKAYGTNFLTTTAETIKAVKEIDHPGVRLNLDLGTMILENEPVELIKDALPFANHIHISAPYLAPIYESNAAFYQDAMKLISSSSYNRAVSIEMKASDGDMNTHLGKAMDLFKQIS